MQVIKVLLLIGVVSQTVKCVLTIFFDVLITYTMSQPCEDAHMWLSLAYVSGNKDASVDSGCVHRVLGPYPHHRGTDSLLRGGRTCYRFAQTPTYCFPPDGLFQQVCSVYRHKTHQSTICF